MEKDLNINEIISIMKTIKKTDELFKPIKKLKTALESIGVQKISLDPSSKVIVFHFGLGNDIDKQFILLSNPIGLIPEQAQSQNFIIPGHSYCILKFQSETDSKQYVFSKKQLHKNSIFYSELSYKNLNRILVYLFLKDIFAKELLQQEIQIQNCSSSYGNNYESNNEDKRKKQESIFIPGLFVIEDFLTKEEQQALLMKIDQNPWVKLNNRRVQHYGYQFKYGQNAIDKQEFQGHMPQFVHQVLFKLKSLDMLKNMNFDQLTINDYFAGNGIPTHFDTHSPFEEFFVAISILSGITMDLRKYNGDEKNVYLKQRSVVIFSGEARYAWTHGIACRKMDRVDHKIKHRSRRISLTFRKIKFTPCSCPFYFYCDSQGYNQQTMKKNNPLLLKYLSESHKKQLEHYKSQQIEKQFVQKAYNGFGFDFHNKVIEQIKKYLEKDVADYKQEGLNCEQDIQMILDVGCGNGQYSKYLQNKKCVYFPVEKCTTMIPIEHEIYMDCLRLCFKSESFDKILFIAVLHHFASFQTRSKSLKELTRVLKLNGMLYITVLFYEAEKRQIYQSPDIFLEYCLAKNKIKERQQVPYLNLVELQQIQVPRVETKGQIYKRYYHLFTKQEVLELIHSCQSLKIVEYTENKQNIIVKAQKVSTQLYNQKL